MVCGKAEMGIPIVIPAVRAVVVFASPVIDTFLGHTHTLT